MPEIGAGWVGLAASPNQRVFKIAGQRDEWVARNAARVECEQVSGRTCNAIAIPESWDAVALSCGSGRQAASFIGGSGQGYAMDVALDKALHAGFNPNDCRQFYSY